ncbi:hypothetical protein GCM10011502_28950 [Oceanisphaera marina]|uniref:Diguanylate cyclase n=2 Tax=Oceanisphaera marina TaxID=2017550 RepID=A0ABQ1IZ07_9GAMM|nr:hypothetical protein GCM10011502_28950 [Oceanisphaera marina]
MMDVMQTASSLSDLRLNQMALEQLENGVMLLDAQQRVLFWNQWLVRYTGINPDDAHGQRLEQLFDVPLPVVVSDAIKAACEHGLARLLSHKLHRQLLPLRSQFMSDGQDHVYHSMMLRPLHNGGGVVLVQLYDLTNAVRRERYLREKEQALRKIHFAQSAEKRFMDTVLDTISALVVVTDARGCIVNVNCSAELALGFSQHQLQGKQLKMLLGLDSFKHLPESKKQAAELRSFNCHMTNADGKSIYIRWTVKAVKKGGHPLRYLIYTGQDITERERASALLQLEREMLEMAAGKQSTRCILDHACVSLEQQLESCRVAVLQVGDDNRLQIINGPSLPESFGEQLYSLQNERLLRVIKSALRHGQLQVFAGPAKGKYWQQWLVLAKQFKMAGCWLMPIQVVPRHSQNMLAIFPRYQSHPHSHEPQIVQRISHLAALILERQHQQEQIEHLALYDSLTGLANRSLLNEQLQRSIHRARRTAGAFALLFIDLDGFKAVNDTYGHDAGDALLIELGQRLRNRFRANDCCARIGGDEFVVLLDDTTDGSTVMSIGESLLTLLATPLPWGEYPLRVTASIGIASYPANGDSAGSLLTSADNAMYRASNCSPAAP